MKQDSAPATTYRITPAPRYAGMMSFDCARCGRVEVKPVFLDGGEGSAPYGTGCAARMLGWLDHGTPRASKVRDEAAAVERRAREVAAMQADRMACNAAALAAASLAMPEVDAAYRIRKGEAMRVLGGPTAGFRPAFHQALAEGAADGTVIVCDRTAEILAGAA